MFALLWCQRIEFGLDRVSISDRSTDSLYEVLSELVDSNTAKLGCHRFPETLNGFQITYIMWGVGFQEITLK